MTQEGSGSGALSAHCQTWHGEIYRQACETSMHTRLQLRDGALVEIYTFDEAFDRHVTFAVETYLDYAPPSRSALDPPPPPDPASDPSELRF